MDLETVYYIIAIVFMALMLTLIFLLVAAALVIRAKINRLHSMLDDKAGQAKAMAVRAMIGLNTLRYFIKK
ncbi:hypothetical protein KY385_00300 [Candidatus Parcubacteria bacterium]|nr:hypothetical protein [Candidatus Parcubacteria bacterium]